MKKLVVIVMALVAVSFTANAQLGGVVGGALKKAASKTIDKTIDKTVDKTTDKVSTAASDAILGHLGLKKNANAATPDAADVEAKPLTPEEAMALMPSLPTEKQVVDHLGYERKQATLKLIASPVSKYVAQLTAATMRVTSESVNSAAVQAAAAEDEMMASILQKYGLTREQFESMSDEEKEAFSKRYADDMLKEMGVGYTVDQLENMSESEREAAQQQMQTTMMAKAFEQAQQTPAVTAYETPAAKNFLDVFSKYHDFNDAADAFFDKAKEQAREIWETKYAAKAGEGALASYWVEVVPLQFEALKNAQELIKTMQLPVAAQLNDAAAAYDKEQGKTMYSSRNYIMDCALNYLRLGLRLTDVYQPTF